LRSAGRRARPAEARNDGPAGEHHLSGDRFVEVGFSVTIRAAPRAGHEWDGPTLERFADRLFIERVRRRGIGRTLVRLAARHVADAAVHDLFPSCIRCIAP
jgi:hypothetical protein